MSTTDLDRVRGAALDRIERGGRRYRAAFAAAALLEAAFLVSFVALADLSNRSHVLLLLAAVGVYSIVALGLIILAAHVNRCTECVLQAIEALRAPARPGEAVRSPGSGPGD